MTSSREITARLVIIECKDNRDKGKIIPLKKNQIIIGRGQSDINLNDLQVSRAHVSLEFNVKTGELVFTDLGSTNGTLVNGELRKNGVLKDRDRLKVGNTIFDCQLAFESQTQIGTSSQMRPDFQSINSQSFSLEGPSKLSTGSSASQSVSNPPEKSIPDKENRIEPSLPPTLSIYQRIPKSVRIGTLAVLSLFVVSIFFTSSPNRSLSNKSLDTYVSEINKLLETKQLEQAKVSVLEAGKAYPKHSVPLVLLGNIYYEQRKIDLAIDAYKRSLPLQPTQLITYIQLIRLYLIVNKKEEAKALLSQYLPLLDSSDANTRLHVQTGELFLEYPELEPNKEALVNRARKLQTKDAPDDSIGYKLESTVILMSDKSVEGLKKTEDLLKKGLTLSPKDDWIFDRIFYLKITAKNTPEALSTLETWIKTNPKSTRPLILFAYQRFTEQNYLGAVPYLQKIISLLTNQPSNPHYSEALNLLGQVSFQQNQLADAENFLRQSCQLGFKPSCSHPLISSGTSK